MAAKESGLKCTYVNNDDLIVLVSGGGRHHGMSMCTVWPSHWKMTEQVEQKICIKFAWSLNTPLQKLFRWFTRVQLWAASDWQLHHNMPTHASCLMQNFLAKYQITQVTQPCYSPDLVPCDFRLFPKLKSPLKGKRFHTVDEIQENTTEQLMVIGKNCVRSQGAYFEGDWGIVVLCTMFLISSSINVSIFHVTWLDTFWTDPYFRLWEVYSWSLSQPLGSAIVGEEQLQTRCKWTGVACSNKILFTKTGYRLDLAQFSDPCFMMKLSLIHISEPTRLSW